MTTKEIIKNAIRDYFSPLSFLKLRQDTCKHESVQVFYVKPITLEPSEARCNQCGKNVTREWVAKN